MGNVNDANLLGKLTFSFNLIAGVSWITYLVIIATQGFDYTLDPDNPWPYNLKKFGSIAALTFGILFSIGGCLCGALNRMNVVPGESKGNWNNGFFFAGIALSVIGGVVFAILVRIERPLEGAEDKRSAVHRAAALIVLISGCWLLGQPDLLPKDCVKD